MQKNKLIALAVVAVIAVAGVAVVATQGENLQGYLKLPRKSVTRVITTPSTFTSQDFSLKLSRLEHEFNKEDEDSVFFSFLLDGNPELDTAKLYAGGSSRKIKLNTVDTVVDNRKSPYPTEFGVWWFAATANPRQLSITVPLSTIENATKGMGSTTIDGIYERGMVWRNLTLELCKGAYCETKDVSADNVLVTW